MTSMSKRMPPLRRASLAVTLGALLCGARCDTAREGGDGTSPCPRAVPVVKADLATRLGTSAAAVAVVSGEEVTWPDGCLGVPQQELCAPNPVVGCRLVLNALGTNHEYHTDREEAFAYAGPVQ